MANLYRKVDDAIMYEVNKGVRAWNWTTGQTKADLANQMLTVAPILEGTAGFMNNAISGVAMSVAALTVSHYNQKLNLKQQNEELDASEKEAKIDPNRGYEKYDEKWGIFFAGLGGAHLWFYSQYNEIDAAIFGIGHGARSSSHYVMRADYLPPRKNVFSRAKDRLVEMVKDSSRVPAPQMRSVSEDSGFSDYFR